MRKSKIAPKFVDTAESIHRQNAIGVTAFMLQKIYRDGQRSMRRRAKKACEDYRERMDTAAKKREAGDKPNTVALCKADAGNTLAGDIRKLPIL